jgi:hypothetical protein
MNKQLDEILNAVTNFTYDAMAHPGDPLVGTLPTMDKATAKQALLDWHNKQVEEAVREARVDELRHIVSGSGYSVDDFYWYEKTEDE